MKKINFITNSIGYLILFISFISCSSELDFDQVDDLKLEPVVVTNLSYFDLDASKFPVSIGSSSDTLDVEQDFSPFESTFLRKNLNEIVLDFEVENTIPRDFSIDLVFLDKDNIPIHTVTIDVLAYIGTPVLIKQNESLEGKELEDLQQMAQVGFRIKMKAGLPFSSGHLKLRSGATLYLEIE